MDHKKVKIGNENFKEWLKTLDPHARVRHMASVGRTLYSMGLRVVDIKAALAQLSQRCQVMLVRLNEKDIKRYTRRKPLKRLHHHNPASLHHTESIISPSSLEDQSYISGKNCAHIETNLGKELEHDKSSNESPTRYKGDSTKHHGKKPNSSSNFVKRSSKKDLMIELFGEEDGLPENSKFPKIVAKGKEINNYLSTTVSVKYYDESSDLKRKSTCAEDSLVRSGIKPQKQLRIDVSVSSENMTCTEGKQTVKIVQSSEESGSNLVNCIASKKPSQKHSKRKCSGKKKSKKERHKSSKNSLPSSQNVNSEEDPSIKELWSILGMESPTDRTAKFLSNQLGLSSSETITLHSVAQETDPIVEITQSNNNTDLQTNCLLKESDTKSLSKPSEATQINSIQEVSEPFIRISETFSLATSNDDVECTNKFGGKTIEKEVISSYSNPETNDEATLSSVSANIGPNGTATRNQNSESQKSTPLNTQAKNIEKPNPKIGTIRVKNLGALVDPSFNLINNTVMAGSKCETSNQNSENAEVKNVTDLFFANYSYYFDELVESKIPKLGELLHLAIADAARLVERVKRADQLSSEDLIREEKLRAEKDFQNIMKLRGNEFAPLCDEIVRTFDTHSKISMFLTLFCRILKHAASIDSVNENYVMEAKKVIDIMLKKIEYKDKDIMNALIENEQVFKETIKDIQNMLDGNVTMNDISNVATNKGSKITSANISTASHGYQGATKYQAFMITEDSFKRLQHMLSLNNYNPMQKNSTIETPNGKGNSSVQIPTARSNTTGASDMISHNVQHTIATKNPCSTPSVIVQTQAKSPQIYNTSNGFIRSQLQAALTKNMSKVNEIPRPKFNVVLKETNKPRGVNKNIAAKLHPKFHTETTEISHLRNSFTTQQLASRNCITPLAQSRTVGISTQATASSTTTVRSPTTSIASPILPSPTLNRVDKIWHPPQSISVSITGSRSSVVKPPHRKPPMLTPITVVSTTNTNLPSQNSTTITSEQSKPGDTTLPRRGKILIGNQSALLNRPEPGTKLIHERVSMTALNEAIRNTSPISGVNPNIVMSPTGSASTSSARSILQKPTSPEVTSPPAEMNLPSSSHCHPFIARRPISGKMKMLFGNNTSN